MQTEPISKITNEKKDKALQLIQNSASSTIVWHQCDIRMLTF